MIESLSAHYYNQGLDCATVADLGAAIRNLTLAVSYCGNHYGAWNLLGLCFYRLGKYKMAEYSWRRSSSINDAENAARVYLEDLEEFRRQIEPHLAKVSEWRNKQKYRQAVLTFEKEIVGRFELSVALLNYLGVLRMLAGKRKEAVNAWHQVLALDTGNPEATRYLESVANRHPENQFWKRWICKR